MLSEGYIWDVFWQLSLGILHMHSHNLIHRDIKPLNILLTIDPLEKKRIIKLADLGDSRFIAVPEVKSKRTVGTPLYMPPEIIRQDPYDNRVFLIRLDICFYRLIYGL